MHGFAVVTASNAVEALAELGRGLEPCLIVLDLAKPGTNGADFRRVQEGHPQYSRFPVVAVADHADVEDEALKLGIRDSRRKAILLDGVIDIVNRNCRRHQ